MHPKNIIRMLNVQNIKLIVQSILLKMDVKIELVIMLLMKLKVIMIVNNINLDVSLKLMGDVSKIKNVPILC